MVKKSDMVKAVARRASITQAQSEAVIDAFLGELTDTLARGERVQFMGVGAFEVKRRAARVSRNPRTGEPVDVPASNYVSFAVGKKLKEAVKTADIEVEETEEEKPKKKAAASKATAKKSTAKKSTAKKTTAKKSK